MLSEQNKTAAVMNSELFVHALEGGLDYFKANYHTIDNLNVFPVPDGDTGVNMLLTLEPAVEAILKNGKDDYTSVMNILQEVTTINSRGNSGFILSQFFTGFAEVVRQYGIIDREVLVRAFSQGHYIAKTAISTPMNGTMLSVFEAVVKALDNGNTDSIVEQIRLAASVSREEVFRSPEKLPVLKKAGVVDSGALGFAFLLEGMKRRLDGEEIRIEQESDYRFEPDPDADFEELMNISHRYCTELTVRRSKDVFPVGLEDYLNSMGDSVALLVNEDIIKLHVHTNEPEKVVGELSKYGQVENRKIEDMKKQIEEEFARFQHENEIGVLAIVPGEGFRAVLHDFEPDLDVLVYGKNLPKTGDILNHIRQMPYEDVIVLANDKNIIPAVQLVKSKIDKHIEIFPSKNIIQGISAVMGFVKNLSWQENLTQMHSAMELVDSISIYRSVKHSKFANIHIPLGHYFAVTDGNITAVAPKLETAVIKALSAASTEERSMISFYYKEHEAETQVRELVTELQKQWEDIEMEVRYGGQHTAELLIGLE
jgi:uncharacterized protein